MNIKFVRFLLICFCLIECSIKRTHKRETRKTLKRAVKKLNKVKNDIKYLNDVVRDASKQVEIAKEHFGMSRLDHACAFYVYTCCKINGTKLEKQKFKEYVASKYEECEIKRQEEIDKQLALARATELYQEKHNKRDSIIEDLEIIIQEMSNVKS